jgi:hypothetical protein
MNGSGLGLTLATISDIRMYPKTVSEKGTVPFCSAKSGQTPTVLVASGGCVKEDVGKKDDRVPR